MDGGNYTYYCGDILYASVPQKQNFYHASVSPSTVQRNCSDDYGNILVDVVYRGQLTVHTLFGCGCDKWDIGHKYRGLYHPDCNFCDLYYTGRNESYWLYRCYSGIGIDYRWIGSRLYCTG